MVKVLILYYLSIKETHGYEIQKYIQNTGISTWSKVKSGSIYYALSKMEKKGEVELVEEKTQGSRVRRIYKITQKGKEELKKALKIELSKDLVPMGTEKFISPSFLCEIDKESGIEIINKHIKELKENLEYWEYWKNLKVVDKTQNVERISFEMTIDIIKHSIEWHEALVREYDYYVTFSSNQAQIIKNLNFDEINSQEEDKSITIDKEKIQELKDIIENKPQEAKAALEELLKMFNSK